MADKTIKFTKTSPHAAYSVAVGISDEDAKAAGLEVVENDAFGTPTAWGKYDSEETGE